MASKEELDSRQFAGGVCRRGSSALTKGQCDRQLERGYGETRGIERKNARERRPIEDQGGAGSDWP